MVNFAPLISPDQFQSLSVTKSIKSTKYSVKEVLADYRLCCESREASLMGRKEVFMGKAKFGIFGDGKELAQVAMAKAFKKGDFRSGYYRDQTFMMAIGELTLNQYFAQLYAHTDIEADPASAGRLMNGHFATRLLDESGQWKNLADRKNSTADISPTAAQMPRLVGLAYASKLFRENRLLRNYKNFSTNGNEVAFGTIGNAATSEGIFFESLNAAGVLQVPMLVAIWDDDFGISVPKEYHSTKGDISAMLSGFQRTKNASGYELFKVNGWDYEGLCGVFIKAADISRKEHVPALVHVAEMTQPQGHSTSGSHERYKTEERLAWEKEFDCLKKMREWILDKEMATAEELDQLEKEAKQTAKEAKQTAWKSFNASMRESHDEAVLILDKAVATGSQKRELAKIRQIHQDTLSPLRLDDMKAIKKALRLMRNDSISAKEEAIAWLKQNNQDNLENYSSHLYSQSQESALLVPEVKATYGEEEKLVDGRLVLQACFDAALTRDPRVFAIGEDVGALGDVNQAFAGLQEKHGILRVTDTGIRECTIVGQGIGAALRGLRPIVEIQYLDYLLYALQILSDDLATLQYRTRGGQKAPLIVRTRGHRLEGVWHAGSPMGMLITSLQGMHILVPRNMTQAAGFYNTLLLSDEPALVVECLNGYRLKERLPSNIDTFAVPLGIPEVILNGSDVTVVTYGSMCRIVMEAAEQLQEVGISCEVIDVQTLLPFDRNKAILTSLKKTNRIVFADEDVPGGATAFMMQQVLEEQEGYNYLDAAPLSITAKAHRPAYGSDGDYFSKPNVETVFDGLYNLMAEAFPGRFPDLYN